MATKDPIKNRAYVAKSRQNLIDSIGITEYKKRNAEAQRTYKAKRKAFKNTKYQIEEIEILM